MAEPEVFFLQINLYYFYNLGELLYKFIISFDGAHWS